MRPIQLVGRSRAAFLDFKGRRRTSPHYSRLAADLSEASGIGRVDGGFRGGFSLRVGD
jgi:hypothetical protein